MRSSPPDRLFARPIAHRGLHGGGVGPVENSLGAARAAIALDLAIECDVQVTCDGEAVVFHDFTLDRLTHDTGAVDHRSAAELTRLAYRRGTDRLPLLATLLEEVGGRVPLICEIKSRFDGDLRLTERVRALAASYPGPLAIKSFDPAIIGHLRKAAPCPLGIVAQARYDDEEWDHLAPALKRDFAALAHFTQTRPDFLSYHVDDLPHAAPVLCRAALAMPVVTWTVRRPDQRDRARLWADQIVFEGFVP